MFRETVAYREWSLLANSKQHREEELFTIPVVSDRSSMPPEEIRWRHVGLVAHDRDIKQLLFEVHPARGKLAHLCSMAGMKVFLTRE